jgi:L-malate glycosyltransferase
MSSLKRVLIIENSIHVTGALKSITRVAFDLRHLYSFVFVLPLGSQGRFLVDKFGFKAIYELPMKELSRRVTSFLIYLPALVTNSLKIRKLIRKENIDLIHVNDLYNLIPVVYKLSGGSKPYICHIRFLPTGFPKSIFNLWLNLHLKFSERIIVVSHFLKNQLPSHDKIEWIPNELPIDEQYPPADFTTSKKVYTFLYLANFIPGKGQNYALEAFARTHEKLPNWRLRFAGGDMGLQKNKVFRDQLKARAHELGIDQKIDWVEFVEDTEREYKSADIILNFSEAESFSITCLEALFYGMPLIATDCGGPAEIVDHNLTGLLVLNRDIDSMAKTMIQLANDKDLRIQFEENSRSISRKRFSLEKTSYRLYDVYQTVLENDHVIIGKE